MFKVSAFAALAALCFAQAVDAAHMRALTFVDSGNDAYDGNSYGPAAQVKIDQNFQLQMLTAVNQERARNGLPALCLNNKLEEAAQEHSDDMARNNYMDHTGADGSNPSVRAKRRGYAAGCGENVAAGQVDVADVMKSWMESPGHRANILGKYTHFGAGYALLQGTTYKHYWTQKFGGSTTETCSSGPAPAPAPAPYGPSPSPSSYTPAPTTQAPTPAPSTKRPETPCPSTGAPTQTPAPSTKSPETPCPTTGAPTQTPAPTTKAPETPCPTTGVPATKSPATPHPTPAASKPEVRAQC